MTIRLGAMASIGSALFMTLVACQSATSGTEVASVGETENISVTVGTIDAAKPAPSASISIIPEGAEPEILAEGFTWPEGPVWIQEEQALYFNDVPENRLYRWSEADGLTLFLTPSGGGDPTAPHMREPGANGMIRTPGKPDHLLLADHGSRGLSLLSRETQERTVLVSDYQGKSLNSPNDMVRRSDDVIFFTDPPYGLKGLNESPHKELAFNGVYAFSTTSGLKLLTDGLSFPNGIGLSPDEETLYVAVSDPENPVIMSYNLAEDGSLTNAKVFFDGAPFLKQGGGLPDGMVVASNGTIFATGPDGVYIIQPDGEVTGVISTGMPISNCTLDDAEEYLYMTSSKALARIPVELE